MKASNFFVWLFIWPFTLSLGKFKPRVEDYSALSCAIGISKTVTPNGQDFVTTVFRELNETARHTSVKNYVSFYVYTMENPNGLQINFNDLENLKLNASRPTNIVVHGYLNRRTSPVISLITKAYLESGDYNIIAIDWWPMQSIASVIPLTYWSTVRYVPHVGKYVAKMLDILEESGIDLSTTTLIGHSLGAHIMGIAGLHAKNKVGKIVGLDPAMPLYEASETSERLSTEDAITVEVIHTNEGNCGLSEPIGHFDFYPNGGRRQPGCYMNTCSHTRSYELYAEAIRDQHAFYGRNCEDFESVKEGRCFGRVARMGGSLMEEYAPAGLYYLETRGQSPYAVEKV